MTINDGYKALNSAAEVESTQEELHRSFIDSALKQVNTCLPAIIDSFDPATQTAKVQPAIQRLYIGTGWVSLPVCVDVPVMFPQCGQYALTFPLSAGDEVLLIFGQRSIDYWHAYGGVQQPSEHRVHDLSDAFAIPGVSSLPKVIPSFNADDVQLRTRDGTSYAAVKADGSLEMVNPTGSYVMQEGGDLTITYPNVKIVGNVELTGNLTTLAGGSGTGEATFAGTMRAAGDVIAGNGSADISLLNHVHSGVTAGPDLTGGPQ